MILTGTNNSTVAYHCAPCSVCSGTTRLTTGMHGYQITLCTTCGTEQ